MQTSKIKQIINQFVYHEKMYSVDFYPELGGFRRVFFFCFLFTLISSQ